MAITPEQVDEKRFGVVRLKEGYDMEEVDTFLDEVAAEMRNLVAAASNAEAAVADAVNEASTLAEHVDRAANELQEAQGANAVLRQRVAELEEALEQVEQSQASEDAFASFEAPAEELAAPADVPVGQLTVSTTAEASDATRRLLEIAIQTSEQLTAEAEVSADEVIGKAKEEAEFILTKAETDAKDMVEVAQAEKVEVEAVIASLKSFESNYRESLTEYFSTQLEAVRGVNIAGTVEEADEPAEDATGEPAEDAN